MRPSGSQQGETFVLKLKFGPRYPIECPEASYLGLTGERVDGRSLLSWTRRFNLRYIPMCTRMATSALPYWVSFGMR